MKRFAVCETELGWIGMVRSDQGICALTLPKETEGKATDELLQQFPDLDHDDGSFVDLADKFRRYSQGEQVSFDDEVLDLSNHTPFHRAVWEITRAIPYGKTRTYGSIAIELGRPKGARAVGQAMGANPVPLIVPCHRVLAFDGSLHGFAGGLPMKERLLRLEGAILPGKDNS